MLFLNDTASYRALLTMSIGAFLMASWSVMKVHITDSPIFQKVRTARLMLVLTYMAIIGYNSIERFVPIDNGVLTTLFIASGMFESLFMIFFLIILINPALLKWRRLYQHMSIILVLFAGDLFSTLFYPLCFEYFFSLTVAVYLAQLGGYAFYFAKVYRHTTRSLTEYYEEEEEIHIMWIRNSLIGLLAIGLFTAFSALSHFAFYGCYIVCYSIAYSYIAVGFINRYYKYSKILPAVVEMTEKSRHRKGRHKGSPPMVAPTYYDKSRLALSLDLWISEKGYVVPNVPMEDILKILDTSAPVLHAFMQDIYGMDFRNWRNELRLEYAYNLLTQHQEDSVETVARKVGFSDVNYFVSSFIHKYDVAPRSLLNGGA